MPKSHGLPEIPERGWRCPPAGKLAAYIEGQLTDKQRRSLEHHLADCDYCRKSVAGAMVDSRQPAPETPVWLRQKAEAQMGEAKSRAWRWAWALAPVLVALLVVAVLVRLPGKKAGKIAPNSATQSSTPAPNSPVPPSSSAAPSAIASRDLTRGTGSHAGGLKLLAPTTGAILPSSQLHFAWTPVAAASSYRIRITTVDGALIWEQRSEQPRAQAPATLKLAPGSYFAWVTAYLDDGREKKSAPISFSVQGWTQR